MPDLQGFMPQPGPGTIYGGNWSEPYSGVMDTLASVMRARDQRNFAQSPFGGSFQRRFSGNFSPIQNELDAPSEKTGQVPGPAEQARLISALQSEAEKSGQFTDQGIVHTGTSGTYAGPVIQSNGPLQAQPYYQQLIAAAQGGANMPMIVGSSNVDPFNPGIDQVKQQDYRSRRKEDMAGRRAMVQKKAMAAADQRAVGMGNLSEQEAMLNALSRMQGGGADPFMQDAMLLGPEAAAARQENQMKQAALDQQAQFRADQLALEQQRMNGENQRAGAALGLEGKKLDVMKEQGTAQIDAQKQGRAEDTALQREKLALEKDRMNREPNAFQTATYNTVGQLLAANPELDVNSLLQRLLSVGQSIGLPGAPAGAVAMPTAVSPNDPTLSTLYDNSGGDWDAFQTATGAASIPPDKALAYYKMKTGEDPVAPGFWGRQPSQILLGNWLSGQLGLGDPNRTWGQTIFGDYLSNAFSGSAPQVPQPPLASHNRW